VLIETTDLDIDTVVDWALRIVELACRK
jgi:hypothetical protein